MTVSPHAVSCLVAFLVSAGLSVFLARSRWRIWPLDLPNERSLHADPTPRTGGIAILSGLAAAGIFGGVWSEGPFAWIGGATAFLALLSFLDDRRGLPVGVRFAGHAVAATAVVVGAGLALRALPLPFAGRMPLGPLAVPFSVLLVVWMTNLYNFMDGMDGFAGSMTLVGFGTFGGILLARGGASGSTVALALAAASAGFLVRNFPPARLFMGDVGAIPIGFLAGTLTLYAGTTGVDPAVSAFAFAPFVLDATVTLVRRALRRETLWRAHRDHYYQRLALAGLGHRRTLLLEWGLMLVGAASAVAWASGRPALRVAAAAATLAAAAATHAATRSRERRASAP